MSRIELIKKVMLENERRSNVDYAEKTMTPEQIKLKCRDCGHEWHADGYSDMGSFQIFNEEHGYCSECGGEGKDD